MRPGLHHQMSDPILGRFDPEQGDIVGLAEGGVLAAGRLAERFDIALMSTKGMSVIAARQLVERLSGGDGVPLFVLHDFDKAGLSIASTLVRDTRRYQFAEAIKIVDLGLRLPDIEALGLEVSAEQTFDKGSEDARRPSSRGADDG